MLIGFGAVLLVVAAVILITILNMLSIQKFSTEMDDARKSYSSAMWEIASLYRQLEELNRRRREDTGHHARQKNLWT